jgi:hypothetical protein
VLDATGRRRSSEGSALADTSNVFKSPNASQQIEMIAVVGQRSADEQLARDAARLQMDLREQKGVPSLLDLVKIAERCNQLGANSRSDLEKQLGEQSSIVAGLPPSAVLT